MSELIAAGGTILALILSALGWTFRELLQTTRSQAKMANERADRLQAIIDRDTADRAERLAKSQLDIIEMKAELSWWKSHVQDRVP